MINTRFEERKLPGAFCNGNLSHCATLVFRFFAGSSKFKALGELITTFDVAVVIKAPDQKEFRLYPAKFNPSGHVNVYSKSLQWDHAPLPPGQINIFTINSMKPWAEARKHFFYCKISCNVYDVLNKLDYSFAKIYSLCLFLFVTNYHYCLYITLINARQQGENK